MAPLRIVLKGSDSLYLKVMTIRGERRDGLEPSRDEPRRILPFRDTDSRLCDSLDERPSDR
jgi:hypothetical protein